MTRWVVLLRGINVGGANRLPMAELRATCTTLGFEGVSTYIQSGNIVLDDPAGRDEAELTTVLAEAVSEHHGLTVPVVARRADELAVTAERHPDVGGPVDPKLLHVLFLDRVPAGDPIDGGRFAPDRFVVDGREVFVTYPTGSGRSKLTIDVFERAWGVTATARNLNTVRRLVEISQHR